MSVNATQLTQLYLAYFGRPPDFDGFQSYLTQSDATIQSVAAAFSASPESQRMYGTTFGAAQINAIYQNLFNRDAEIDGLIYWAGEVNSGRLSPAMAAYGILVGAQNADKIAVQNKLAVATSWLQHLDTSAEIVGYSGDEAANIARTFLHTVDSTTGSLTDATGQLDAQIQLAIDAKNPTWTISPSGSSVNEGSTVYFTLSTTGIAAGTHYNYTLSGVSAADVVGGQLTGTATIGSNGQAVIAVELAADATTEGAESLKLAVANREATVTVNDTSKTPAPTYALSANALEFNEGGTVVFTVTTTNVPAGTVLSYTLFGDNITAADVVGGQLIGTAVVGSDGKANFQVTLANDVATEGLETLKVSVAGLTGEVQVLDTSITPPPPVPTYAVSTVGNQTSVDEGSQVTFAIATTNVAAGTTLSYAITGVDATRLGGPTSGQVTVDSNGQAVVTVQVLANHHTDGAGSLTLSLLNGAASGTVAVNDTSLTPPAVLTVSTTDVIPAQPTDDLILGQLTDSLSPTAASTLNASDVIHGGAGNDTLRITADGSDPTVQGFTMDGVETLEINSYTTGDTGVTLGLVNVTGLQTVKTTNSTGNIVLKNVGSVVGLDLAGNGETSIDLTVQYTNAATNLFTDQAIAVNGFVGEVTVGNTSGSGIEAVEIASNGVDSYVNLNSTDVHTITVTGDAALGLQTNSWLDTVDAAAFDAGLNFSGSFNDGGTITVGNGDNSLDLYMGYDATVTTGSGDDSVNMSANDDAVVNVGEGSNSVSGSFGDRASITAGAGDDSIYVSGGYDATIAAGEGNNYVSFGAGTGLSVTAGAGDDDVYGTVYGDGGVYNADLDRYVGTGSATIDVGAGHNEVYVSAQNYVGSLNVTGQGGDDYVAAYSYDGMATDLTVNVGDGENYVGAASDFNSVNVTAGSGDDDIEVQSAHSITIAAGAGSNYIRADYASYDYHHDPITHVQTTTVDGTGDITITATDGGNDVSVSGADDTVSITLGGSADGAGNDVYVGEAAHIDITSGAASDSVEVYSVGESLNVSLGDGDNSFYLGGYAAGSSGAAITITSGSGSDWINLSGTGGAIAATLDVSTGAGDDTVALNWQGLHDASGSFDFTIDGGEGSDTLVAQSLDSVNGAGDFANVTNFETLQVNGGGNGSLDGVITGANDAGINHYAFEGYVYNVELTNVTNASTVDFNGGSDWDNFTLTVAGDIAGSSATVNVNENYGDDFGFNTVTTNVETLNLNANSTLSDSGSTDGAYVEFDNIVADNLKTLTIGGNSDAILYFDAGSNTNLASIDSTASTGDVYVDLTGVTMAAGFTATMGSGSDDLYLGTGGATVSLGEGNNSLTAMSGGGDYTVTAGNGDNYVAVASDAVDTVTLGNGNNEVYSFGATSFITTGSGNDTIYAYNSGVTTIDAGAGDDTIYFEASALTAADVLKGGAGQDTLVVAGSLGTVGDAFFRQWNGIETLQLSDGGNNLTLGFIAHNDAKLQNVVLSDSGLGDTLNVAAEFGANLGVTLGNGDDHVVSSLTAGFGLSVDAFDYQLTSADSLLGGAGVDTLTIHATSSTADLAALAGGFNAVVIDPVTTTDSETLYAAGDFNAGGALSINASAMVDDVTDPLNVIYAGNFTVDAALSTGALTITGAKGAHSVNTIDVGTGLATIHLANSPGAAFVTTAGAANVDLSNGNATVNIAGNSVVTAGNGTNSFTLAGATASLTSGNGANTVVSTATASSTVVIGTVGSTSVEANTVTVGTAGSVDSVTIRGNGVETVTALGASVTVNASSTAGVTVDASATTASDSITTGAGNDVIKGGAGADTINAGNGTNSITGGGGADVMTGGTGVDTFKYLAASDSSGLAVDTITNFTAGSAAGHDKIDLSAVATTAGLTGVVFLGNVSTSTIANTALPDTATVLNVVYVTGEHTLYADVNHNGVIDTGDMAIELTGVATFNAANLA